MSIPAYQFIKCRKSFKFRQFSYFKRLLVRIINSHSFRADTNSKFLIAEDYYIANCHPRNLKNINGLHYIDIQFFYEENT